MNRSRRGNEAETIPSPKNPPRFLRRLREGSWDAGTPELGAHEGSGGKGDDSSSRVTYGESLSIRHSLDGNRV